MKIAGRNNILGSIPRDRAREAIIEQGCCPNCYGPEPCECDDLFESNFADHLEEIKRD